MPRHGASSLIRSVGAIENLPSQFALRCISFVSLNLCLSLAFVVAATVTVTVSTHFICVFSVHTAFFAFIISVSVVTSCSAPAPVSAFFYDSDSFTAIVVRFVRLTYRVMPCLLLLLLVLLSLLLMLAPLICRLIWLLMHATTFIAMLAVLLLTWEQFIAQYFVINLKDPLYPIENVPFPAVSICSNNRISMQAVINYAQEL